MKRAIALIDGEHYPPVVRAALEELGREFAVMAAVFLGGTEKIDMSAGDAVYGMPAVFAETPEAALSEAIARFGPDVVVDLSDEPVASASLRFVLASIALGRGVEYRGSDFRFSPPSRDLVTATPALAIIGTGKRVGKTAVSAHVARQLKAAGHDVVVVAMGRGGPPEPELIRGDEVELTTSDLLALARAGRHAASDNYEDAVMSRVTTVGCRRCGGGLAGETSFGNVREGVELADSLGKELVILEGSGAAIPPAAADATILVVGADRGAGYVRDYFGPYRVGLADLVIVAGAEESTLGAEEIPREIARLRPGVPVVGITFRPAPIASIEGRRVFFATTAPSALVPSLASYLDLHYDCQVVGSSPNLSNRARLRADMDAAAGTFDLLVTELKAAAIDVVAEVGEEAGVETVLCDNRPVSIDGSDLESAIESVAALALQRGHERGGAGS